MNTPISIWMFWRTVTIIANPDGLSFRLAKKYQQYITVWTKAFINAKISPGEAKRTRFIQENHIVTRWWT